MPHTHVQGQLAHARVPHAACCLQPAAQHIKANTDVRKGPIGVEFYAGGTTNLSYNCLVSVAEEGLACGAWDAFCVPGVHVPGCWGAGVSPLDACSDDDDISYSSIHHARVQDRWVEAGRGSQPCFIWEGNSYGEPHARTNTATCMAGCAFPVTARLHLDWLFEACVWPLKDRTEDTRQSRVVPATRGTASPVGTASQRLWSSRPQWQAAPAAA